MCNLLASSVAVFALRETVNAFSYYYYYFFFLCFVISRLKAFCCFI